MEEAKNVFNMMYEHNISVSYIGPFDYNILTLLAENIEESLWQDQYKGRKFFKIFIELAQNISLYSSKSGYENADIQAGEGTLVITENPEYFEFYAGNYVNNDKLKILIEKCDNINSLDREGLRQLKRNLRNEPHEFGGGNIGLVHVALISGYPLKYKLVECDNGNESFYIICVRIDK